MIAETSRLGSSFIGTLNGTLTARQGVSKYGTLMARQGVSKYGTLTARQGASLRAKHDKLINYYKSDN